MKQENTPTTYNSVNATAEKQSIAPGEIIIGTLVELNDLGEPCVDFPGNISSSLLNAMSTIGMTNEHIGKQVALLFANGNILTPIIMGVIHNPLHEMLENFDQSQTPISGSSANKTEVSLNSNLNVDDALIDGKKITFEAKEQIILKCGESSITLTKAGKILIRGKYLLNRSTGVNRIMGGSVQVN